MVWPTLGSRTAKEQEQELHSFNDLFSGQPLRSPVLTRAGICVSPTVTYLPYRVFGSTLAAVGRFQLLARWPETHSRIFSGIHRAAQTVLGVYLKRTCSRVTSASSALGVLNDYALYESTHSITRSLTTSVSRQGRIKTYLDLTLQQWHRVD